MQRSKILLLPIVGLLLMTNTALIPESHSSDRVQTDLLTDFSPKTSDLKWYVVNDTVMGGRSSGDFDVVNETLKFAGTTNTNGGGFSSIRSQTLDLDLSEHEGIQLKLKGDGRRYTWRLSTTARWRGRPISYWAEFATQENAWTVVNLPFEQFKPQFRGYKLDGPKLATSEITGMGLMIYDKENGPFEFELESVHAYREAASFSLDNYQWKNRILILSAANKDDDNLVQQLENIRSTSNEFDERDMIWVALLDDRAFTSLNQTITNEEAMALREVVTAPSNAFTVQLIGKDGQIKMVKDAYVTMQEIYALIDRMPMRRAEIDRP